MILQFRVSENGGPHQPDASADFLSHAGLPLLKDVGLLTRAHNLVDGNGGWKSRSSFPQSVQKSSLQNGAEVEFGHSQLDDVCDCLFREPGPTVQQAPTEA